MEEGGAVRAGSSRSRAGSRVRRSSSKNVGSFISAENWRARGCRSTSRFRLLLGIERLGGKLAIGFLQEDFHSTLRLFQLFLALTGECYAFFEKFHRVVQSKFRAFPAAHDFLEAGKRTLKIGLFRRFGFLGSR